MNCRPTPRHVRTASWAGLLIGVLTPLLLAGAVDTAPSLEPQTTAPAPRTNAVPSAPVSDATTEPSAPAIQPLQIGDGLARLEPAHWYNLGLSNHLDHVSKGHPTNLAMAIEAYRKAAEGGCAPALVNLGYAHDLGFGVTKDPIKAVEYYQRAAELGNPVAAYNLGRKYFTGTNGLPLDWSASQRYLEQAAGEGLLPAQHLLGQLHVEQGRAQEGLAWISRAASHGYVPSMYSLGNLYQYGGRGVAIDYRSAVQWHQKAAEEDFVPAQYQLGVLHDAAPGVQNTTLAEAYFRKAAERGHRDAQHRLGEYYYRGRSVPVDLVEAYRWWTLASEGGLEVAAIARRQLLRIMPPTDQDRGQRLVAEFRRLESTYRERGMAQIRANARPEPLMPAATGAGFVVSTSGHVLTSAAHIPDDTQAFLVSLVGGRLKADKITVESSLGLAVVRVDTGGRMLHPLTLQTNRTQVSPGSWVFCAQLSPAAPTPGSTERLAQVSVRTQVARSTGSRADPRHFCLGVRLDETHRGSAVLNTAGEVVGMVVDPSPTSASLPGAVVLSARHLRDFLRANGVEPLVAPAGNAESLAGEAAPTGSPHTRNSLVNVAAYRKPLP